MPRLILQPISLLTIFIVFFGLIASRSASLATTAESSTSATEPHVSNIIPNPVVPPIQPLAPAATPAATLKRLSESELKTVNEEHRKACEQQYTGKIQSEVRLACQSPTEEFHAIGVDLAQTRCRLNYGEEPRLVTSCLIGVAIYSDLLDKRDEYRVKQRLCAEHYPSHTEIDSFLQESCLVGAHLPRLLKTADRPHFEVCATINPERSFIGPCAAGLSLASDAGAAQAMGQQNKMCEQFFDHRQFHIGYRSCLAARGLGPQIPEKLADAMKACSSVIANAENDTERAACMVGLNIFRRGDKQDDLMKRFGKCGATKVSYEDRDFLACLTAASLIDLADKSKAGEGCRDVYRNKKSSSRKDCLEAIGQL